MILQCPACNARYAVPDHAIGAAGRTVKCVKCAHQWFVAPPQATSIEKLEELLKEPEKPVSKPIPKGSNVPKKTELKASAALMGTLVACFVIALGTTLFTRHPGLFGFTPASGVSLAHIKLQKQQVETGMEYAISAELVNMTDEAVKPPQIRITLVDQEGAPLKQWEVEAPVQLNPKQVFPVSYGPLKSSFPTADRLVIDLGNSLELAMRSKP